MELTVVLAGIPVRLSLRSPAYAACFQPFWTEADPVAAVRVPEDALAEAAPRYEAGTTPEQVEYLELGPRVCDALLPYGRILFHGAAVVWRGRVWVFTANSGTGKTTQYMLWKLCFGSEIKILNGDKPLLEFREGGILVHPSPWRGKEGLGSLDPEALNKAYLTLAGLTQGNRLVGVISHVAELKEKIDRQIVVKKDRTGQSRANIVAG